MKIVHLGGSLLTCITLLTACTPFSKKEVEPTKEAAAVVPDYVDDNILYLHTRIGSNQSAQAVLDDLIKQNKSVIVDFYADWCGPCRSLGSTIERIADKHGDVLFVKVNIDTYEEIAKRYNVRSIPVLVFYKNGQKVNTKIGGISDAELTSLITKYLN